MLDEKFLQTMKSRLLEEKRLVEEKIAKLEKNETPLDNPSPEDLAQDAAEDILEESLLSVHREILERIEFALEQIKKGTYGRCILCGAPVAREDLEKEPWAEHCRVCKK